jgi:hypothetical protein
LNPEKIVIGGVAGPSLAPIVEEVKQNVNLFSPLQTKIEIACLGERAQALGALWYLFELKCIYIPFCTHPNPILTWTWAIRFLFVTFHGESFT